ncbi:hypothetical protein KOI35_17110 [Actinoplanes bogorensis]|uniref:Secreted protein n=1 Tax=Paractinoplanes bogorensis TaxID=1610840 RepID=A0ABS5YP71_9ACTN|nr:hypothetical protein [Actinoplanes bogorensis]MBU2665225.1 hypothetical protein [Actinoplanes bogorensis]
MNRKSIAALAVAVGTVASTAMVNPAGAASVSGCAGAYKIVSVSIKYKGCQHVTSSAGQVLVDGARLNDHGSPVSVSYQFALRDSTAGSVTYGGTWFTQTWPTGSGMTNQSERFACIRGHSIRGLMHVKVNGSTGAWSESPTFTCR